MGPPGVAHDTISIDRLGNAGSSPPGAHVADPKQNERNGDDPGEPGSRPALAAARKGCSCASEVAMRSLP